MNDGLLGVAVSSIGIVIQKLHMVYNLLSGQSQRN